MHAIVQARAAVNWKKAFNNPRRNRAYQALLDAYADHITTERLKNPGYLKGFNEIPQVPVENADNTIDCEAHLPTAG